MIQSDNEDNLVEDSGSPSIGEPLFLIVGKLHRPHGLRGEIKMTVLTDFPERIEIGNQLYVGSKHELLTVSSIRYNNKQMLIGFEGITDRETAGNYRNTDIWVKTEEILDLPEGEYYHHQIIGLNVVVAESNRNLGVVESILATGANNVFIVKSPSGQELLIPDIDEVVQEINLENKEITIALLPGLIEEDK